MTDCIQLLDEALEWLGANYSTFHFFVERDVAWTLQSYLARRIHELQLPFVVGSSDSSMDDIALFHEGSILLALNVKYEPANSRRLSWTDDVIRAARQFKRSAQRGPSRIAGVVVVDESGHFRRSDATYENGRWTDWAGGVSIFRFIAERQPAPANHDRLVEIVRALAGSSRKALDERKLRESAAMDRTDFLWWRLVHDILIQGNSSDGAGSVRIETLYDALQYDVFAQLKPEARFRHANRCLVDGGIRMARKKSLWLLQNFVVIAGMGGPAAAKDRLLACPGRNAKIRYLKQTFSGIGDQGARSIMMAAYHEEFRNSIAIDEPINRITRELEMSFSSYAQQETFLLNVAAASGLEGWELDRLLSEQYKAVLNEIKPSQYMVVRG